MTVTPWLANYPFSDPMFQNFNVQQYLTVSGVNPTQTFSVEDPDEVESPAEKQAIEAGESPEAPKPTPVDEPPKKSASQAAWAAYAISRGTPEDMAVKMSRQELIALIDAGHPDDAVAGFVPEDSRVGAEDDIESREPKTDVPESHTEASGGPNPTSTQPAPADEPQQAQDAAENEDK